MPMVDHVIVLNISSTRTLTLNSLIFWSRPQTWFSRTSTVLDVGKWNYGNGNCPAKMKIAVEGCCHGELDRIYETLVQIWEREGVAVDLLICCGDFQAVRNDADLNCMAVPFKYRKMNTFYKYYSGERVAPVLTIFVGGNHEASNHLWELSYGGWVAPNIYYMGNAGVVRFGGLRIAGISGIYKAHDYGKGHFESPPYTDDTKRSAYHVRSCDVFRLKQLPGHVDVMVSHDWPQGIYHHGNTEELLRKKPFFAQEVSTNSLGSPPLMELLQSLAPDHWFSAHLHVRFEAIYNHQGGGTSQQGGGASHEGGGTSQQGGGRQTRFLALDKCLPRRKFLQILDIPTSGGSGPPYLLEYDRDWLAILRLTEPLMRYSRTTWLPPHTLTDRRYDFTPTPAELQEIDRLFGGDLRIPPNFIPTVPVYDPYRRINHHAVARAQENPQTTDLCRRLGIRNPFTPGFKSLSSQLWADTPPANPDEITLDDSGSEGEEHKNGGHTSTETSQGNKPRYPWLKDDDDDVSPFHAAGMEWGPEVTNPPLTESDVHKSNVAVEEMTSKGQIQTEVNVMEGRTPLALPIPMHPSPQPHIAEQPPSDGAVNSTETPQDITEQPQAIPDDIIHSTESPQDITEQPQAITDDIHSTETPQDITEQPLAITDDIHSTETPQDITEQPLAITDDIHSTETPQDITEQPLAITDDVVHSSESGHRKRLQEDACRKPKIKRRNIAIYGSSCEDDDENNKS